MTCIKLDLRRSGTLLAAAIITLSGCEKAEKQIPRIELGDTVTIGANEQPIGMAGTSIEGLQELSRSIAANDNEGVLELLVRGRMAFVDTGRIARVLEKPGAVNAYVLRLLSGPNAGTKIWINPGQIRELSDSLGEK